MKGWPISHWVIHFAGRGFVRELQKWCEMKQRANGLAGLMRRHSIIALRNAIIVTQPGKVMENRWSQTSLWLVIYNLIMIPDWFTDKSLRICWRMQFSMDLTHLKFLLKAQMTKVKVIHLEWSIKQLCRVLCNVMFATSFGKFSLCVKIHTRKYCPGVWWWTSVITANWHQELPSLTGD